MGRRVTNRLCSLFIALLPWTYLWQRLLQTLLEFRAHRYADGLSFKETLQRLFPYVAEKKVQRFKAPQ
jgi:hypothetical protein